MKSIKEIIGGNTYPGRGILIGVTPDGKNAVTAYFIMGRSVNSRNRVFASDGESLYTEPFDPSKLTDPSLIIYRPVRMIQNKMIVTNGDQTDTIYDEIKAGGTFESALRTRTFEPDPPNYTPRISGILSFGGGFSYKLSILKSAAGNPESAQRYFYEYDGKIAGAGHLIHTYEMDGYPLPSFEGEPRTVEIPDDIDQFTNQIWDALDRDNRVSLFVKYISLSGKNPQTRILNSN